MYLYKAPILQDMLFNYAEWNKKFIETLKSMFLSARGCCWFVAMLLQARGHG